MEKQRLLKLTPLQQKILAKVFLVTQKYFRPEQAERDAGPAGKDPGAP